MCELFGVNGRKKIKVNSYLQEFFSHSFKHNQGWGMALFYGPAVSLEKEALGANQSYYLKSRLSHDIVIDNMIAHIRLASIGQMNYENTHPFVKHDNHGRSWTLAHNGTIFDFAQLDAYRQEQEGQTDSERILYYLIDHINRRQDELGHTLTPIERFSLLETLIAELSVHNKLNLLIWDGEFMYVHTNYRDTLYMKSSGVGLLFATQPLDPEPWQPVPFLTLQVYRLGQNVFSGTKLSQEYFDPEKDFEYKNVDYSNL